MKLDHFPWTGPDALAAVGASFVDNGNAGFHQFDGIFRTDADTTAAVIAFTGHNMNH